MLYVSGNNQADDIEAFNSTSRVDHLLKIYSASMKSYQYQSFDISENI